MGTVLQFYERAEGRAGSVNDVGEREYTRSFTAITSDRTVADLAVLAHPDCPKQFDPYVAADGTFDTAAWATNVSASVEADDPTVWRVTARYSNKINRPDLWEIRNPLLRPADLEWDTEEVMIPMEYDDSGEPVRSTAEGRFDPPPERPDVRLVLRVAKNLPSYNPLFWVGYCNAVNDAAFMGFPAGSVQCRRPRSRRQFENGIWFQRLELELVVRQLPALRGTVVLKGSARGKDREAWDKVLLNQDLYERTAVNASRSGAVSGSPCPVPTANTFYCTVALGLDADSAATDCLKRNGRYDFVYSGAACVWDTTTGGDGSQSASMDLANLLSVTLLVNGTEAVYTCDDFTPGNGGLFRLQSNTELVPDGDCQWPETIRVHGGTPATEPEGTATRCGSDGFVRTAIRDPRLGQPVTTPWPLDEFGEHLPLCSDPVWLVYRVHPRKNFNLLPVV